MVDLRYLRSFVAVAEELHFTRAAERLHVAQSALSSQIKTLEREVGAVLLVRNRRSRTKLTRAGEVFLDEARRLLEGSERARLAAQRAARGAQGTVRIAYVGSAAFSGVLTRIIAAAKDANDELELLVSEMQTPRQIEAIASGAIDVGFLRWRPSYPAEVQTVLLLQDPVLIALPHGHPLAARDGFPPGDLAAERFITPHFGEEYDFRHQILDIGRHGGFSPQVAPAVRDFVAALTLVGAGLGVAPVPSSLRRARIPGVVFRPVHGLTIRTRLVGAFRSAEESPAVREVIDRLRQSEIASDLGPADVDDVAPPGVVTLL